MKIMVSKAMAKALNKAAKELNKPYTFYYRECGLFEYRRYVNAYGNISGHDIINNNIKYIAVVYPDNYYAMDSHITFYDLDRLFIPGDTTGTYTRRVVEDYEI